MRSFIVTLTLIFAIACTHCSARKEGCNCSGLGTGSNPCGCNEIVVKAAKQSKPLHYVAPEAIAEAAVTREILAKITRKSAGGNCGQPTAGINYVETTSLTENPILYEIIRKSALVNPSVVERTAIVSGTESSGGCGCDASRINPTTNARIVPKFPPIGDMCHTSPTPSQPQSSSQQIAGSTVAKVTPAYPGKIKCSCSESQIGQVDCMSVLSSLVNGRGLAGLAAIGASKATSTSQGFAAGTGSATTALSGLNNGFEGFSGKYIARQGTIEGSMGSSSANSLGVFGEVNAASRTSANNVMVPIGNAGRALLVAEEIGASGFTVPVVSSNNAALVEVTETVEQQVVPHAPADPVSLSLAYKNLIPQRRRLIVSEDRLSFGPTATPKEAAKEAPSQQIDEEKLVTIEKPVMQLQVLPTAETSAKTSAKTSAEEEEEVFAELDTLERMRLDKESTVECAPTPQPYVTYRELGYAPVVKEYAGPTMINIVRNVEEFSASTSDGSLPEAPCGPMGPAKPDYVPGAVYLERVAVEPEPAEKSVYESYGDEERSVEVIEEDEDDEEEAPALDDTQQPGFLARLSTASRKYGASVCPF